MGVIARLPANRLRAVRGLFPPEHPCVAVGAAEFRKSEEYALLAVIKWSDLEMGISAVPLEKLTHFSPDSYASRVRRHRE